MLDANEIRKYIIEEELVISQIEDLDEAMERSAKLAKYRRYLGLEDEKENERRFKSPINSTKPLEKISLSTNCSKQS